MPLEKTLVPVDLMQGLDRKHDSKTQKIPGKLVTLENGVFVEADTISKGGGYSALPAEAVDAAAALPSACMLATRGAELLQFSAAEPSAWAYSPHADRWAQVASDFQPTTVRKSPVIRNSFNQSNYDAATVGGISLWAYEDSRDTKVRYTLFDEVNGSILQADAQLSAGTGNIPRVLVCNNTLVVVYQSGANLTMNVAGGTIDGVVPPAIEATTGALWRFDEDAGATAGDATGGGANLTSANSLSVAGATGKAGLGRSFASGSEVTGPVSSALATAVNNGFARSFSFWVFRSSSSAGCLLRVAQGSFESVKIGIDDGTLGAAGHIYIQWLAAQDNGTYLSFTRTSGLIANNAWTQVVWACESDSDHLSKVKLKCYLNGLEASVASNDNLGAPYVMRSGAFVYVGHVGDAAGDGTFIGTVDELEVQGRTLHLADAKARFASRIVDPSLGTDIVLKTDMDVLHVMDAVSDGTSIWIAYRRASDGCANIIKTDETGVVSATTNSTAEVTPVCISLGVFSGGNIALVYGNNGANGLRCRIFAGGLGSVIATVTVDATFAARRYIHVTCIASGTGMQVLYDVGAVAGVDDFPFIRTVVLGPTGSVVTALAVLVRHAVLCANAFLLNGLTCVAVTWRTAFQPTLVIYGASGGWLGAPIAKALVWRHGGDQDSSMRMPSVLYSGEATVGLPALERGRLAVNAGIDVTAKGITRLDIGDYTTHPRQFVESAGCTFLAGALPAWYDGQQLTEHGFLFYPELFAPVDGGAGGTLAAGIYSCVQVYEWTDQQGNLWRSIPSIPSAITLAANHKLQYVVECAAHTRRKGDVPAITIAVFRTEANGTIYHRVWPPGTIVNDTGVDTVTSALEEADVSANEILYTVGGVLGNQSAPPCTVCCGHQGRIVADASEEQHQAWYSKLNVPTEGAGFSETLTLDLDPVGGAITALASLDDALVLFKEAQAYVVPGQGPDDAGQSNGFANPQLVSADAGVIAGGAKAVVRLPDGLAFPTLKGLRLMGHGFQVSNWGADVDPLAVGVLAGVLDGVNEQARFYLSGGTVLVWDYLWQQWSTLTNHASVDAVLWRNQPAHLRVDGTACVSDGSPTHAGTAIALKLETSWLSFAGVQGFQRVWRMLLLGTFLARSRMTVELAYDFEDFETLAAPSPAPSVATLPTWRLNETSGDAIDVNAVVTLNAVAAPGYVPGKVGNARTFNGVNQYFVSNYAGGAAQIAHRLLVLGEWTVGGWVYVNALGSMSLLEFSKNGGSLASADNTLLAVLTTAAGYLLVQWQHGSGVYEEKIGTQGIPITPFEWKAWAVRKRLYSGSGASGRYSLDFFFDGQLVQSFENIQNADGGSNAEWFIGRANAFNSWLNGAADDVWCQPGALSETAILAAAGGRLYSRFVVDTADVGSLTAPLSIKHHLARQKCGALRVRITESGGDGLGFSLSSLGFEVGTKRGARKTSGAASKG